MASSGAAAHHQHDQPVQLAPGGDDAAHEVHDEEEAGQERELLQHGSREAGGRHVVQVQPERERHHEQEGEHRPLDLHPPPARVRVREHREKPAEQHHGDQEAVGLDLEREAAPHRVAPDRHEEDDHQHVAEHHRPGQQVLLEGDDHQPDRHQAEDRVGLGPDRGGGQGDGHHRPQDPLKGARVAPAVAHRPVVMTGGRDGGRGGHPPARRRLEAEERPGWCVVVGLTTRSGEP